jgi:hypothetical protein
MWVATTDFPTAASHPFYTRLNQLLAEHHFDDFVEGQCRPFYAEIIGRPSLSPGMYFRAAGARARPPNLLKRLLVHASAFKLGLWMRTLFGIGAQHAMESRVEDDQADRESDRSSDTIAVG